MTLKIRLAAMMVFLLVAVMALQYVLAEREQRELVERLSRITSGIDRSTFELSERANAFAFGGGAGLDSLLLALEVSGETDGERRFTVDRHTTRSWVHDDGESGTTENIEQVSFIAREGLSDSLTRETDRRLMFREARRHGHPSFDSMDVVVVEIQGVRNDTAEFAGIWTHRPADLAVNIPVPVMGGSQPYVLRMSYPLDEITAELQGARQRSLLWLSALLGVGVLGASMVAFQFTRPILALQRSFRRVESGELDVRLVPRRNDEIGQLTASFNQMVSRLQSTRAIETRLAEAERLATVGNLAAGVAHEVRNPLNAIRLSLEQLRDKAAPREGAESREAFDRYYGRVASEIGRLEHLVTTFLDLSGSSQLALESVDLVASLRTTLELFEPEAAARRIAVVLEAPEQLVVRADGMRISMVWSNLLANAIAATPEGGTVTLRVREPETGVEITCEDTGPGIPPELEARVFEPFVTGHASGTGLGLSIVRSVVEAHGGSVRAGTPPDGGARITVSLPRGAADA